jgi:hypothetical protein
MAKVWGQYRADARQVYPGKAKMGDNGPAARVVLRRFRDAPQSACGAFGHAARRAERAFPARK